jgi:hypothetical protein
MSFYCLIKLQILNPLSEILTNYNTLAKDRNQENRDIAAQLASTVRDDISKAITDCVLILSDNQSEFVDFISSKVINDIKHSVDVSTYLNNNRVLTNGVFGFNIKDYITKPIFNIWRNLSFIDNLSSENGFMKYRMSSELLNKIINSFELIRDDDKAYLKESGWYKDIIGDEITQKYVDSKNIYNNHTDYNEYHILSFETFEEAENYPKFNALYIPAYVKLNLNDEDLQTLSSLFSSGVIKAYITNIFSKYVNSFTNTNSNLDRYFNDEDDIIIDKLQSIICGKVYDYLKQNHIDCPILIRF